MDYNAMEKAFMLGLEIGYKDKERGLTLEQSQSMWRFMFQLVLCAKVLFHA